MVPFWGFDVSTLRIAVYFVGVGFLLLVALALVAIGIYNRLVALRNRYRSAFSQIDVQLKRRHDLIPNLVETVKAYMKHEKETLKAVIDARNQALGAIRQAALSPGDAQAMKELAGAEGQLNGALGRLFAVAEAYPELKANQNMLALQEELGSTENRVAFARQAYNDSILRFNTQRATFPDVLLANILGFTEARFFEIEAERERVVPQVSFT